MPKTLAQSAAQGWPGPRPHGRRRTTPPTAQELPPIPGQSLDPCAPAIGRGYGNPGGSRPPARWKADVAYVPRFEQRDFDAVLSINLRRLGDGTKFRYVLS